MKKLTWFIIFMINFTVFTSLIQAATISGFITDKSNGEPIAYANVIIVDKGIGASTNNKGYFIIPNVPQGELEIMISHISYPISKIKRFIENENQEIILNYEVESQSIEMNAVEVTDSTEEDPRVITPGRIRQNTRQLKQSAQIAEPDVFRAVQALPGVLPISDFSSGLYIRGGSQDQNLFLIDGIDVYNPTHFGGLFSTFNADAVRDVELLKSSFPSKYGGRLSAVLDVSNRDGNRKEFEGVARISLLSSSLTMEGPWKIGNQKGSYMVSFRRTYLELIEKMSSLNLPDYYFYDGHAKLNYDISGQDKLSFSTYFGKDQLNMNVNTDMDIHWGNQTFSSQWIHIFSPKLFSHFILAGSNYKSEFRFDAEDIWFLRGNKLNDITLKGILSYKPVQEHMIDFGFEVKNLGVDFYVQTNDENTDTQGLPDVDTKTNYFTTYLQDNWEITPVWTIQPGIRMTYLSSESNLKLSQSHSDFKIEPRFSIKRKLSTETNLSFGYGKYYQYMTSVNIGEASPFDLWFPLDETVQPGMADHYTLTYDHRLQDGVEFSIEGYYKDYNHLVFFKTETDWEWDNEEGQLEDIFNKGLGYSFGFDVMLKNNWKGIEGFIGYSYCNTKRKYDNMNVNPFTNEENFFFPKYDRTHQITLNENFTFKNKFWNAIWRFGISSSYYTGQPYYEPEYYFIEDEGTMRSINSYQDRFRLPDYFRIDLSINAKWDFGKWNLEPYIQTINVTNHKNVWYREYIPESSDENPALILMKHEDVGMFPFIIFVGFNANF